MAPCAALEEEVGGRESDAKDVMFVATSHLLSNEVLNLHIEQSFSQIVSLHHQRA
jgi:hypothetical protein